MQYAAVCMCTAWSRHAAVPRHTVLSVGLALLAIARGICSILTLNKQILWILGLKSWVRMRDGRDQYPT